MDVHAFMTVTVHTITATSPTDGDEKIVAFSTDRLDAEQMLFEESLKGVHANLRLQPLPPSLPENPAA